jgi:hypothetical protein
MIVRVYTPTWKNLRKISNRSLDIAAGKYGEWYDLVVDQEELDKVIASGLPYEIRIYSLEYEKEKVRGAYSSYSEMTDSLRTLALSYPTICAFDSLPIPTYEGRWIYGVKISDNPQLDEADEPKFSLDGCHHAREWATPQAVMFFADSMLRSYDNVAGITDIINTTEMYCFPVINVDGYVYDYQYGGVWWRKNLEPFGGYIGNDPNRNYGGACNGELDGEWGAVDEDQATHYPESEIFCGAYAFSGDEVRAYAEFVRDNSITTGFSLHSSGEQVMYPWSYTAQGTPDSTLYEAKATYMASLMQRIGGGTYTPGQSYNNPYPTSGGTRDWMYGYCKWIAGLSSLSFGAEIGTDFYQNPNNLDFISRQVFKAAEYLAGFADSLILVSDGFVPAPDIYPLGTVGADFVISWNAKNNFDNHPTQWELVELSDLSVIEDSLESGSGRWLLEGFTLSTAQHHSGTHSFFSGSQNEMNNAVRTAHPYCVENGDSLVFWCLYNLETDFDVAVIEVSLNTKEWFCLDNRYTGSSGGWIRKAYSLADWAGRSIYIRFRAMTDYQSLGSGFYVDDVHPVCLFQNVDTVASNIVDTQYVFVDHPEGEYYYYVRGYNSIYGWGDYSCLERTEVIPGIAESDVSDYSLQTAYVSIYPNPFSHATTIRYSFGEHASGVADLILFDATGRRVASFTPNSHTHTILWLGKDDRGKTLPSGVYFINLRMADHSILEKVVLLR